MDRRQMFEKETISPAKDASIELKDLQGNDN